jgi:hypothetical protein
MGQEDAANSLQRPSFDETGNYPTGIVSVFSSRFFWSAAPRASNDLFPSSSRIVVWSFRVQMSLYKAT